ncbi:LAETG motif-containing sortase-dependent surface protein [Streptomyces sp. NPDC004647]|uniref:LAETG motif-containing sortase-dependent surface protein n=1 Tax=Streptomyces sp. NPDC004647 TaxID=3154671 RepID=UPI0033A40DC4
MKLRRALATAAATAVIAPAALLAAPAAYATDADPAPTVTATSDPAPEDTAPSDPAPEDTAPSDPAPEDSTPSDPAPEDTAPSDPAPEDSTSTSASASASAEPSTDPSEGPVECSDSDEEPQVDDNLVTGFSGLPSKIVAGSGFHNFKLDVSNKSDAVYKRVDLGVFAAQIDEDSWEVTSGHLKLQYQDPESGSWQDISLNENDEGAGYVGYTDVRPHESFSLGLRLSVDASAPAGLGFAISIGVYANDKGECVYSGGQSYYEFDILKAGSNPGEVPGAKPQEGGKKPLPAKPAGDTKIDPKGHLAETGSSSALPVIATIGGVAMVVGAGAVFVVRRRRTDGSTAAA